MAGKRQHYIPQFLLDGFATQGEGAGSFVWVYRKEAPPFKTNVINVAVEQHFYSEADGTTADDYLTAIEGGPIGGIVQSLRACDAGAVSNPLLPELLSHLELRTRHLRRSVLTIGEAFISRILASIADDGWYLDGLERELLGDSPVLRAAIAEELKKLGVPLIHLDAVMAKVKPMLPALMPAARAQLSALARNLQAQLPALLAKSAKSGHIAMLKKASAQVSRIKRYVDLHYALIDRADPNILGDAAVLFQVAGPRHFKAFLDKTDVLEAVFLPISTCRILVGFPDIPLEPPLDLNDAIARCSLESFIASHSSEVNKRLQTIIGQDSSIISDGEMEEIIENLRHSSEGSE